MTSGPRFGARRGRRGGFVLLTRRMTFVIDVDRRLLEVIHSESSMEAHADRALEALRSRPHP